MDLYDNNRVERMWFGTEQKMGWIETPQTGADVSSVGSTSEAVGQNGGGVVRNSWDSHKVYQFSWGNSTTLSMVALLQAYRNGSYGRGLLYFHDPMFYGTNLLPKRWADPSMAVNFEGEPLIPDVWPTGIPVVSSSSNYPVVAASYPVPSNYSSQANSSEHFIPIPDGMTLALGAVYAPSGGATLYVRTPAGITDLIPMSTASATVVNTVIRSQPWARLGIRNTPGAATISITGMTARLTDAVIPAGQGAPYTFTNLATNPSFEIPGAPVVVRTNGMVNPKPTTATGWGSNNTPTFTADGYTSTNTTAATNYIFSAGRAGGAVLGRIYAFSAKIKVTPVDGQTNPPNVNVRPHVRTGNTYYVPDGASVLIPADGNTYLTTFYWTATVDIPEASSFELSTVSSGSGPVGFTTAMDEVLIEEVPSKVGGVQPFFYGGGASYDSDLTPAWVGTANNSASTLSGVSAGLTILRGYGILSTRWAKEGVYSLRLIANSAATPVALVLAGFPADATHLVTSRTISPFVSALAYRGSLRRSGAVTMVDPHPATPGEYQHRIYSNAFSGGQEFWGDLYGGADIWFDLNTVVAGDYAGEGFTGRSLGAVWNGTPDASTSTITGTAPITGEIGLGPWMSGEGHSGCRFNGNPTVVNYTGVNGGQLGLAANFVEVGAWE